MREINRQFHVRLPVARFPDIIHLRLAIGLKVDLLADTVDCKYPEPLLQNVSGGYVESSIKCELVWWRTIGKFPDRANDIAAVSDRYRSRRARSCAVRSPVPSPLQFVLLV